MPAEYHKKPNIQDTEYDSISLQEEDTPPAGSAKKKPFRIRWLLIIAVPLLCFITFAAGILMRNENTFFLENRTAEGYLTPQEYILVDEETGKPGQNLHSMNLQSMSSHDRMMTSRYIQEGSSWKDVVNAYGDVHANRITYFPNADADASVSYKDGINVYGSMTLAEFDRDYVQTGRCDPDTDRIYVRFELWHDGYHLYYTEEEVNKAIEAYYKQKGLFQFKTPYPNHNNFEMIISIWPSEGVTSITTFYL